nr:protein C05E4.5 [imported] - Caenorhabditis elegans [Caenorhabditis elegans]
MYHVVYSIQYIGFFFSQFIYFILLYLLRAKAGKHLGPIGFKNLSEFNFFYIFYLGIFGASFGLCTSLLCTEFMFRYIVICQQKYLHLIEGKRLALLFLFPTTISITWFTCCYFGLTITSEKQEALRIPFQENFGEDSNVLMFVSGQYWIFGANGEKIWCLRDCFGTLGLGICCSVISFCGLKTFKKMIEVQGSMSKQTAALNKQLFLTLTLQTLLPFILMYGPVGVLFVAPFFEWNLQLLVSAAAATTAIYPTFEPLIVIFCISVFRNAIFPCKRSKVTTSSKTFSSAL